MAVLYDRKQIAAWMGSFTVLKALEYAHAVSELRWIALASAILSEDATGAVKFSADDLEARFESIPAASSAWPAAKSARARDARRVISRDVSDEMEYLRGDSV